MVSGGARAPKLGAKGLRTRARILGAAEEVFGKRGFHDASIAEITRLAGVAQGSFYIYFPSKEDIFRELILARGDELRVALEESVRGLNERGALERAGFGAFFRWIGEHPWLYRVARQAEFIDPELRERWYRRFAERYAASLRRAMEEGALAPADPHVLAWCVMGMADFTAMRWIVWGREIPLPEERLQAFLAVAMRTLGIPADAGSATPG